MKAWELALCVILLVSTVAITAVAYFHFRSEWVAFHAGERHLRAGEYQEAIVSYREAIDRGLSIRELYHHLGDAYTADKQFEAAAELYISYLRDHPDETKMRLRLARVLSYSGNLEASSKEYEKVIHQGGKEKHETTLQK